MDFNKETTSLITSNFELETEKEMISEEELLNILSERIAYMIEYKMDFLLSLMYRLDISEAKINYALSPLAPDPPAIGLAKLVIERQKQRNYTKEHYHSKPPEDGLDGGW